MNKIWTCSEGCVIAMSVKDHSLHSFVQHMYSIYEQCMCMCVSNWMSLSDPV